MKSEGTAELCCNSSIVFPFNFSSGGKIPDTSEDPFLFAFAEEDEDGGEDNSAVNGDAVEMEGS
jgi:hypothetical protein